METLSATATAEDSGKRLDVFWTAQSETLSRSRAKALIKDGAAAIDGDTCDNPRKAVEVGRTYTLLLPAPVSATPEPENIPLDILFEDDDLILVNKPAGMTVHPAPGNWQGTLVNALLHHCKGDLPGIGGVERPGIVHRIDRLTSGVLVVAKTELAHHGLSALFAAHDIDRTYLAITRGAPRPLSGTVDAPIARSTSDRKKMAVAKNPDSKSARRAVTHFKSLETFGSLDKGAGLPAATLMECKLETGRTHQIRVHMNHIGATLVGDPVYGRHKGIKAHGSGEAYLTAIEVARAFSRQALHAATLGFIHPRTKKALTVEAPLPDDMSKLLDALRAMPH